MGFLPAASVDNAHRLSLEVLVEVLHLGGRICPVIFLLLSKITY